MRRYRHGRGRLRAFPEVPLIALPGARAVSRGWVCEAALPQMKVLQQAQPSSDHVSPDMRWAGFWLFWAFYTLSGLDVVVGLRRSSEELVLSVTAFASLTVVAGALVAAAWCARSAGVGLLVWVERLPTRLAQSAQLIGLVLLLTFSFSLTPWGTGPEGLGDAALRLGFGLTVLALFCNVRPFFGRRRD